MKTLTVLHNGQQLPAEIRSYENGEMTVLVKDFETAKLDSVKLANTDGDNWASEDGQFTAVFPKDEFVSGGTVLVRVPKK
jgi:hypothetical protein